MYKKEGWILCVSCCVESHLQYFFFFFARIWICMNFQIPVCRERRHVNLWIDVSTFKSTSPLNIAIIVFQFQLSMPIYTAVLVWAFIILWYLLDNLQFPKISSVLNKYYDTLRIDSLIVWYNERNSIFWASDEAFKKRDLCHFLTKIICVEAFYSVYHYFLVYYNQSFKSHMSPFQENHAKIQSFQIMKVMSKSHHKIHFVSIWHK